MNVLLLNLILFESGNFKKKTQTNKYFNCTNLFLAYDMEFNDIFQKISKFQVQGSYLELTKADK